MDEHLYDDVVAEIRKISLSVPGVLDTEKCFVRKSGLSYLVDLHIIVDAYKTVKEGHEIAHQVQGVLKEQLPQLGYVLIHVEPSYTQSA
jgi:divalent metal cation (Fe/Co/Zn/Cd) transporter